MEALDLKIETLAIAFAQAKLMNALNNEKDMPFDEQVKCFYDALEGFVLETQTKNYL